MSIRSRLAFALLLSLCSVAAFAATMNAPTDVELRGRADLVVVATVTASSTRAADGGNVMTDYSLRVEEVLKGSAGGTITVSELGGALEGRITFVPGSARYRPGTRVVAFLRQHGNGTYYTANMTLGAFRFADAKTLVRDVEGIESTTAEPSVEREADSFLEFLRGDAAPPVLPQTRELTPITTAAPSAYVFAAQPPGFPLRPLRWPGCEANCNIGFKINGTAAGVPTAPDIIANALGHWTGDPNSFLILNLLGTTAINTAGADGENVILLDSNVAPPPNVFCDGALACAVGHATTSVHSFRGEQFYTVFEGDVIVRPNNFSESVVGHEIGHVLAFRHSNQGTPSSTDALMNSVISVGATGALRSWDKEAVAEVYGNGLPCVAPNVTSTSGGGTVPHGSSPTLSVSATGSAPLSYQWYRATSPTQENPVGTSSPNFTTPPVTEAQSYWVRVTNACGTDNSDTININPAPCEGAHITTEPASKKIAPGTSTTITVAAAGTAPLKYQWYRGNVGDTSNKVGTSSPTLNTGVLNATTSFWVNVSNACGSDDSIQAVITVGNDCVTAKIESQTSGGQIFVGGNMDLSVSASGDAPLTYEWYRGDAPDTSNKIVGATGPSFNTGVLNSPGTFKYWARVKNACGQADSTTMTVIVSCLTQFAPTIYAPAISPSSVSYVVSWEADLASSPKFELQEADNPSFINPSTFNVEGELSKQLPAHVGIDANKRFYYRVRGISPCLNNQPTDWSVPTDTLNTAPQPQNSISFSISIPQGTTEDVAQPYLVPGFGATATSGDTFNITIDVPWLSVFPANGALSAGGTTVQFTIDPTLAPEVGSQSATVSVARTNATGAGGDVGTHAGTTTTPVPFGVSLVTPVTPQPRDLTPPEGTLIIPAVAHADGIGTRFQSDIRIANAGLEAIHYDISFTPSATNGTTTGKKTTIVVKPNETMGLDDVVKAWFGTGVFAGETGLGTLEIRPIKTASNGKPSALATFASSRTYAISAQGTLGQFIPALPLAGFIGDISKDALAKISLQQIANSDKYRTNLGFVEGSGQPVQLLAKLLDASGAVLKSTSINLGPYEHRQSGWAGVFGAETKVNDGRIEVEVTSATGKVTAYASVIDNDTSDPLAVFPVVAGKLTESKYVVPGVAEFVAGSNFHTDMRIFNPASTPVNLTLNYKPQGNGASPPSVNLTVNPGEVKAIDDVLPTLWNLFQTGGAVSVQTANPAPLVVTARTYSREADGGTYGQFIPAVSAKESVGLGERALEILQLQQSGSPADKFGFRSNLGLVEVTGNPVVVELTLRPEDAKLSAITHVTLAGNEFTQIPQIFKQAFPQNVYNGRVSVKVVSGTGRVAGYGSVVDNATEDPTYVPSQ